MWTKAVGLDGIEYDSISESKVADWLFSNGIDYEPHKRLPKPSKQFCDFYLPDYDLWVEYDGLQQVRADTKLTRKHAFYKKHCLKYLVIVRENWQAELHEAIFCS
jgi:hypothetical protein